MTDIEKVVIDTDVLIVGGGTAGCMAAYEVKEQFPHLDVTIMEKAHIDRSGCLAGGMNAINAFLNPGETPESFVRYVRFDNMGLIREDLVKSMADLFEMVVKRVEGWGLPIQCDSSGKYIPRGRWNIRINGESLKPIIASAARRSGTRILNWVVATNFILDGNKVVGASGFSIRKNRFYVVRAKATIIATGGTAGLYRPNNVEEAQHKTWYCPFNTGAGYAMGIRAGAEMTSFEMRYIGLRTKDVIAPTGTLAIGVGAPQVNAKGERFMQSRYSHLGGDGAPTPIRTWAPIQEIKDGKGPVFLDTRHLDKEGVYNLKKAYLDMYAGQVLYWAANDIDPSKEPVEVQATEPYIVGGHCQSGYWVDDERKTTVEGLWAAGDVSGGAPYKFVSGCWAEGVIAARSAGKWVEGKGHGRIDEDWAGREMENAYRPLKNGKGSGVSSKEAESRLQKILEEYAGGASTFYEMNEERLEVARKLLRKMKPQLGYLAANDLHELMLCHSVLERVQVAEVLIEHLIYRKETRWPGYQTRLDYPLKDDWNWLKFVNSKLNRKTGEIDMFTRPYKQIVSGDRYLPR